VKLFTQRAGRHIFARGEPIKDRDDLLSMAEGKSERSHRFRTSI
jgi:hypothetical protein